MVLHPSYSPRILLGEGIAFAESLTAWDRRPGCVTSLRGEGKTTLQETSGSAVGGGGGLGERQRKKRRERGKQVFSKNFRIYLIENKRKTILIKQR